jgi:hypothetical protein
VDLVTSTFYQKGRQTGTAKTLEGEGGSPRRTVLRQNLFSCQRTNCLNYREAVSFIYNYPQLFYQTSDMVAHEGLYARLKKEA